MAEINFHFDIRVTKRQTRNALALLLLFSVCNELSSESVTLTTYYPAPSGVYTQMITTTNTYLARDSGKVGIGTASPGAPLDVFGINSGNGQSGAGSLVFRVQDGNSRPPIAAYGNIDATGFPDATASAIQVREVTGTGRSITTAGSIAVGGANGTVGSYVMGNFALGTASPAANQAFDIETPDQSKWGFTMRNQSGGGAGLQMFQGNAGYVFVATNGQYNMTLGPGNSFVGVGGAFAPQAPLDVYGPGGQGYILLRNTACNGPYYYGVGPNVNCPAIPGYSLTYATLMEGVYDNVQVVPYPTTSGGQAVYGAMLCCGAQGVPVY